MSIRMMNDVWKYAPAKGSELLLLLAIADFADDDGRNAWPSMSTLAKKTRLSERAVRYIIKELEERGLLEVKYNAGRKNTNRYVIILDRDEEISFPKNCAACDEQAAFLHHIIPRSTGGTDDRSNLMPLCLACHLDAHRPGWLNRARKGEKIYPKSLQHLAEGDATVSANGAKSRASGVKPVSPDPSVNHQESSEEMDDATYAKVVGAGLPSVLRLELKLRHTKHGEFDRLAYAKAVEDEFGQRALGAPRIGRRTVNRRP